VPGEGRECSNSPAIEEHRRRVGRDAAATAGVQARVGDVGTDVGVLGFGEGEVLVSGTQSGEAGAVGGGGGAFEEREHLVELVDGFAVDGSGAIPIVQRIPYESVVIVSAELLEYFAQALCETFREVSSPCLLHSGRLAEAESAMRRGLDIHPAYEWGRRLLGVVLLAKGDRDAALIEMERVDVVDGRQLGLAPI
jgi:hypothetical protein